MKKIEILFILISIFVTGYIIIFNNISIAYLWSKTHVNSLIGLQKIIEKIDTTIWDDLIIPILNVPIFIIYILLCLSLYLFFMRRH